MKFMCKYCNKGYSCGKALGGHLSSHKMALDYDNRADVVGDYDDDGDGCDDVRLGRDSHACDDGGALDYYSLGKQVQGSGSSLDASKIHNHHLHLHHHHHVCKECGKGFRSLKALCGHMACHSEKDRRRCESRVGDKQRRPFADDAAVECSETADSGQMQRPCRRSKRVRFMNHARAAAAEFADGFSFVSGSVPVEEVARCLMMMSNDRRFTGCWGRAGDYSGSPSIESEDKPPSSGGFSGSPRSSDEISYEPKQGYKNLDALKGGYTTKRIKRGITEVDTAVVSQEKKYNPRKRESRHECPICFRVFKSGQAMGGHKRSHFLGGVEDATTSVVMTEKEDVPMFDLNFPAFLEEGDDGGGGGGGVFPG
ncbi:hypothetical protein MLD38_017441 [Melastoma candidum]|uniref:Uncharacterized protein n=1 Tax=Melastoma candidum TaxID=119954 RepID=A0ACB9QPU6_9MYRT|nr:hypothetical protein MLD38_017441 [Melastoma candidum]